MSVIPDSANISVDSSAMLKGEGQVLADKMCEFVQHLIDHKDEEYRIKYVKRYCLGVSDIQGAKEYLIFSLVHAYDKYISNRARLSRIYNERYDNDESVGDQTKSMSEEQARVNDDEISVPCEAKTEAKVMIATLMDLLKFVNKCIYELNLFNLDGLSSIQKDDRSTESEHVALDQSLPTTSEATLITA